VALIGLDLNNPAFQEDWFALERQEALAVFASLRKIRQLEWDQLYRDKGLRWEAILSRTGPGGQRIYSLRITQRVRAVAYRDGNALRFLALHADHDSAYGSR
jgi:hypothetical protein